MAWKRVYDENGYYPVYTTEEVTEDNNANKAVDAQKTSVEGKKKTSKKKKKESS